MNLQDADVMVVKELRKEFPPKINLKKRSKMLNIAVNFNLNVGDPMGKKTEKVMVSAGRGWK